MQGFDLSTISNCYIGGAQASAIYLGSSKIWPATQHDYSQDPLTFEVLEDGQFKFTPSSTNTSPMAYSLDNGTTWTVMQDDTWTATIPAGSKMILDCSEPTPVSNAAGIGSFRSTGNFNVSGNIGSLLEGYTGMNGTYSSLGAYQFASLFEYCTHLISAEHLYLPTDTIIDSCYDGMFYGCTNLITPPELPATSLADSCYRDMFENCTSLTTAPALPATTLVSGCYISMFDGCTSLTTAPELPALTLTRNCYSRMFDGCTSLNSVTCLATDISATYCTSQWLQDVSATGTFTKAASMNDWTTGVDGIPSGWTTVDAS